jgi:hypothetical protein
MKAAAVATAAAALVGGASAHRNAHRHAHLFEKKGYATGETCVPGCTTIWKTVYGEPTRMSPIRPAA